MPSGFSRMFSTRAYSRMSVRTANPAAAGCCRYRYAEMVTATAPETIIARMPVAYAPAWALTSAPNAMVMTMQMSGVDEHDRAHRAAPLRGHPVARAGSGARC